MLAIEARVASSDIAAVVCAAPLILLLLPLPRERLLLFYLLPLQPQLLLDDCILAVNFVLSSFLFRLFLGTGAILLFLLALTSFSGLSVNFLLSCSLGLFSVPPLLGFCRGCLGQDVLRYLWSNRKKRTCGGRIKAWSVVKNVGTSLTPQVPNARV